MTKEINRKKKKKVLPKGKHLLIKMEQARQLNLDKQALLTMNREKVVWAPRTKTGKDKKSKILFLSFVNAHFFSKFDNALYFQFLKKPQLIGAHRTHLKV